MTAEKDFQERLSHLIQEEIARLKKENEELAKQIQLLEESTKELDRKSYNLFILYHASKTLGSHLEIEELHQIFVDMITEVMGVGWGLLYLVDEEHETLFLRKLKSIEVLDFPVSLKIGEGIAEWITGQSEIASFEKFKLNPLFLNAFPEIQKLNALYPNLIVPLIYKARFLGLLILGNKLDRSPFSENDLELLNTISSLAATAFMNAHLYEMAIRDSTTRLFVPRYFRQRLNEEIKRAKRYVKPISLAMFDIDNFKQINDFFGHLRGDQALVQISGIIRASCREDVDIPCRYGGEEFALVLPETDANGAYLVAERIRVAVENASFFGNNTRLTISCGVACYPHHASTLEELIENADRALYRSKKAGKNKVTIHNSSS
jgi:diguanylate cyclase (GGDEF)-like protein